MSSTRDPGRGGEKARGIGDLREAHQEGVARLPETDGSWVTDQLLVELERLNPLLDRWGAAAAKDEGAFAVIEMLTPVALEGQRVVVVDNGFGRVAQSSPGEQPSVAQIAILTAGKAE